MSPNAPEERKPVTANPSKSMASTNTGLKRRKTGVAIARPIREPIIDFWRIRIALTFYVNLNK